MVAAGCSQRWKNSMKKIIYLIILIQLIGGFLVCEASEVKSPLVTMAKYHKIATGMSYSQVVKIIGAPGIETARSEHYVMFSWSNSDEDGLVAIFKDDKLISKAQSGLR